MRRPADIPTWIGWVLLTTLVVILAYAVLAAFFRGAKVKMGPGPRATIRSNLGMISDGKEALKATRHVADGYWPTRGEIAAAYTGKKGYSFDALIKHTSWGEVYVVNQIGAAPYAYLSNAVGGFPEGCLLTYEDLEPGAEPAAANRSQPLRAETNRESAAAGPTH